MEKAAKGKRGAVNKVTHVQEVAHDKRKKVNEPEGQTEALEMAEKRNEALEKARELSNKEQKELEMDKYEKMLNQFKTKSI
jgi:putative transposase